MLWVPLAVDETLAAVIESLEENFLDILRMNVYDSLNKPNKGGMMRDFLLVLVGTLILLLPAVAGAQITLERVWRH